MAVPLHDPNWFGLGKTYLAGATKRPWARVFLAPWGVNGS
jgi:hypothetical protein